ncbi:glycosyltransferase family 4 protein [Spirochaeta cellobiosiphila]|uniref:glycosyltransferase family 4 protein n=1 Tax=Spirochaeta cellobiosiphila TaxID=504483 RepID=UPI0004237A03|nr:glycosyltransferase family 4 protein [Spirochaeta cellobiosiphila]
MKKILFIIPSLTSGGAEKILTNIIKHFTGQYNICLMTLRDDTSDFYHIQKSVKRIKLRILNRGKKKKISRFINRLLVLRKAIINENPDLVVSFMDFTNIYVLISTFGLKIPNIISERSYPPMKKIGFIWSLLRFIFYPRATKIVSLSQGVSDYFKWIKEKKKQVIYNFYTPNTQEVKEEYFFDKDKKYIIAMGRLVSLKQHSMMIKAFRKISDNKKDISLVIFGEGPERGNLENLIKELSLTGKVFLPGTVRNTEYVFSNGELFLHTSTYEGFGNVLVEAMAMGLPVVSTDCMSGPKEIVIDGFNGFLVGIKDIDGTVAAINKLLDDIVLKESMSRNAKKSIHRFEYKKIMGQWDVLFKSVLRNKYV